MSLLVLSLLGGLLTLDQTSLGQFMLARPLVSCTLAGWYLGSPETGMAVGAFLEVLFLPAFPVGGARFPEGGPAGVVGAAAATAAGGGPAGLALGIGLGATWGLLGGGTVTGLRRINELMAPHEADALRPSRIVAGHLTALLMDFFRGSLLTAAGVLAGRALGPAVTAGWPLDGRLTVLILTFTAALALGALLAGLGGARRGGRTLLLGLAAGVLAGWFL